MNQIVTIIAAMGSTDSPYTES